MKYFFDGSAYHADTEIPEGAVEVPRLPLAGETWDEFTSSFVLDHKIAADMRVATDHIDAAHALKSAEAAVIASGITLTHGLLFEEAAVLGVPISTLAADVLNNAAAFRAAEIERRRIKATN